MRVHVPLDPAAVAPTPPHEGETKIMRRLRLFAQRRWNCRLFRNNVGLAWTGKAMVTALGVLIKRPYQIKFGLCVGSADVIGFTCVTVTPDMVGRTMAQFTAVEVKGKHGHLTDSQRAFIAMVLEHGGRAGAVRSAEELITLMDGVQETGNDSQTP